jgi:hypothetical protein
MSISVIHKMHKVTSLRRISGLNYTPPLKASWQELADGPRAYSYPRALAS